MTSIGASDLVAERVYSLRKRRRWTIRQLADRCEEIGAAGLSAAVIANIESGRRDKATGERRRDVTIDELLALAYALDAPPVLLCLPYNSHDHLRITARIEAPTAAALEWITGEEPPPALSDIGEWMRAAHPLTLYRRFRVARGKVNMWLTSYGLTVPEGIQLEDSPFPDLADALNTMIGAGIAPPALPETWIRAMRPLLHDPSRVPAEKTREDRLQPVAAAIVTSRLGVLVGRRQDGKPPWTFIAGEVEPADPDAAFAAVREVKEETGLEAVPGEVIGERVHPKTGRTMIYVAAKPARPDDLDVFVGDERELAEVRWVSLAEADELLPGMFEPVREHLAREIGEG